MSKLQKSSITINNNKILTELAISPDEQAKGLMFRENLPPSMAFVYNFPKINKFWMKNTPKELDIVFCLKGKVIEICKGEPYSTASIGPDLPSDLVVEFPYGTCDNMKIKVGDAVELEGAGFANLFAKKYY